MGRRSRRRASAPPRERAPQTATRERPAPPSAPLPTAVRRSRRDAAPQPPWGGFPLIELCALSAIVLGVWGIVRGGRGGGVLITAAALLGSVAGLEVAIREHVAGYRSHTLVLSGTCAFATIAVLFFADAERTTMVAGAAVVLAIALVAFRTLFKRRSGGVGMRVR
jgi:lysylphosphatidylglycerol synthetase-like protein (DUF2156 family)